MPDVGVSKPVRTLTSVDFTGAVRPDQADDLVPVQLERDAVERPHAVKDRDTEEARACSRASRRTAAVAASAKS